MIEVRDDIKARVKDSGRKLTDLSRILELNYDSLNAYVNGRRKMPEIVDEKINKQLTQWEDGV